jgi:pyridoxamine 5'-phosphate oxidase
MASTVAEGTLDLAALRNDYALKMLDERDVDRDPLKQFGVWMVEAIHAQVPEPTAMSLATVSAQGRPASRIVLLKGLDPRGFVFYTNYASRKGKDLAAHPAAALTFLWKELERQVRIEGAVEKVTPEESQAYYATRPIGSRIGAWASPQSEPLPDREALDDRVREVEEEFEGNEVPRPEFWGGYVVRPERIEFWQGQAARLHDRFLYAREGNGWSIQRLAP